jgi:hypothetical protein
LLHPAFLTKEDLQNKTIAVIDLPTDASAKLRFATSTVYAEISQEVNGRGMPTGKSAVTIGENDTASDRVVGVTYYGCPTRPGSEPEVTVEDAREL